MPLARDKLGDLDATERRNLRQRRAEVDGALEGSVLRRVRVQPDLRRVVDAWLRVGRVELRNERALWVRVRGRRRCDGGEEEWVDPLGLARLLLRRPVDLVLTLVRFEADGEGAGGRAAGMRRCEERDGADAELPVRVGREAEREGERATARSEREKVRRSSRQRHEPAWEGRVSGGEASDSRPASASREKSGALFALVELDVC